MTIISKTTRLMMSAAYLYPNDFKDELKERLEHPYKSPAPEFGLDLQKIDETLEKIKGSHFNKSAFVFIVALIAIIILIQDPENNWWVLAPALLLTTFAELIVKRSALNNVRLILAGDEESNDNEKSSKNVIVSGGYSPFVGAGFDLDSWSFTININEADNQQEPVESISPHELHEYIGKRLGSLDFEKCDVRDELYINGKDLNKSAHLLPNGRLSKPVECVDAEYLYNRINSNDKRERHYKVVRIEMWESQIILSMYYRFLVVKDKLVIEARFFLLPPLKAKYLAIDDIPVKSSGSEFARDFILSLFIGTFSWLGAVGNVLSFLQGGFMTDKAKKNKWKKEVEENQHYNYGWHNSLREKLSSLSYERYFQKVDKDIAHKLLTSEFLTSLQDYLSTKNISIDQFSATTTKIVNEGVIISGGEIKAESIAVGKGSKILKNAFNTGKSRG